MALGMKECMKRRRVSKGCVTKECGTKECGTNECMTNDFSSKDDPVKDVVRDVNINIHMDELHIHMEERTDIHNFYPDGFGGLSEEDTEEDLEEESKESATGKNGLEAMSNKDEIVGLDEFSALDDEDVADDSEEADMERINQQEEIKLTESEAKTIIASLMLDLLFG